MNAACTRCSACGVPSPSMVVIALPAARLIGVWHDRTALPSIRTVQAPHWPSPQPNFVPWRSNWSRSTYSSGCAGSQESALTARPFRRNGNVAMRGLYDDPMRIVVLGAGAIGSVYGTRLSAAHDVMLVARAAQADAINRDGL